MIASKVDDVEYIMEVRREFVLHDCLRCSRRHGFLSTKHIKVCLSIITFAITIAMSKFPHWIGIIVQFGCLVKFEMSTLLHDCVDNMHAW